MEALYPKVMSHKLDEFLGSLAPDTIIELWIKLCDYNHYDSRVFDWDDLESMVRNGETIAGIEIVYEDEYHNLSSDYPLSNAEIEERIEGYLKGE